MSNIENGFMSVMINAAANNTFNEEFLRYNRWAMITNAIIMVALITEIDKPVIKAKIMIDISVVVCRRFFPKIQSNGINIRLMINAIMQISKPLNAKM